MKVTLWGTRGSLAAPGPETTRYGGNTSCVEVRGNHGEVLVLDAGTGIRRLGDLIHAETDTHRVDLLLTHLHMDHIQGLGFFEPFFDPKMEVHLWGPSSATLDLRERLARYLSPPLFPVRMRDLPSNPVLHDVVEAGGFQVGNLEIRASLVCHPGPTVGYRITDTGSGATLAYIPDHEPALGAGSMPRDVDWLSGGDLARGVDLLIHDAQFTDEEYPRYVGWGHCTIADAIAFAKTTGVRRLVPFHHDPSHDDALLDRLYDDVQKSEELPFELIPGREGASFEL